jgi:hypothetical protein
LLSTRDLSLNFLLLALLVIFIHAIPFQNGIMTPQCLGTFIDPRNEESLPFFLCNTTYSFTAEILCELRQTLETRRIQMDVILVGDVRLVEGIEMDWFLAMTGSQETKEVLLKYLAYAG